MAGKLFDEVTLRKLEQLRLVADRVRAGATQGERRSTRRGTSVEFADYRNYTRGDDLRRLDWNIFARLERPFIKLLEEEEDLAVYILLDASASMDWPEGGLGDDTHKFTFGLRLAAGLSHVALTTGDHLSVVALHDDDDLVWGPVRGRGRTVALLRFLENMRPAGLTDLDGALHNWALRGTRPGLAILISDLLSPTGFERGMNELLGRGYEVVIVQVLSPDEVTPPLSGDLSLIDSETRRPQDVTVDGAMRELYSRRLMAWRDQITAFCLARGVHYLMVETSLPWEELILYDLRRLQVVR